MSATGSAIAAKTSTLRSVAANWAGLITSALLSLVLTPILIRGLGNLYFGMFMLVSSVLDSCWLLDFGMRTAMFRFIARHRGSGDREELDRTFSSGIVLACGSASLIVLLDLIAVLVLPHFFSLGTADRSVFRQLLLLCGFSVAASFLSQFFGTYQCAFRRFDYYNLNTALTGILRAVLIVVALRLHAGVRTVAAITLFCSLVSLANAIRLARLADPGLSFSASNISRARI
ncbi:MAG TPA: oligosaccharide flippase family protein, partial [Terriglobales bacterium]